MKRYLLSPLCSAFVVPGMGQILNQNLRKGGIILGVVFILLVTAVIRIAMILKSVFREMEPGLYSLGKYMARIKQEDLSLLFYLLLAFALIWLYSVADAFWSALRMEKRAGGESE